MSEKRIIEFDDLKSVCKEAGNISYATIPFGCGFDEDKPCREDCCPLWNKLPVQKTQQDRCDHFWANHLGSYDVKFKVTIPEWIMVGAHYCVIKCRKCGKTETVGEDGMGRTIWPRGYKHD
jgi:hypothetical protein